MAVYSVTPGTIEQDSATTITFGSTASNIISGVSKIKIILQRYFIGTIGDCTISMLSKGLSKEEFAVLDGTAAAATGTRVSTATASITLNLLEDSLKVCFAQDGTNFVDSGQIINSAKSKADAHMSCRSAEV